MSLTSKHNDERLATYARRLVELGRYRLWCARLVQLAQKQRNVANVAGYELRLPDRNKGIAEELRLFGRHEPHASQLYAARLHPGMSILEVGTNLGYYLAIADRRIGCTGSIIGVEPDPELFALATANAANLAATVEIKQAAVSDMDGTASFYRSNVSNWGALRQHVGLDQSSQLQVNTLTIDSLLAQNRGFNVDAIRMDIEGHELAALRGAPTTLRQRRPLLFLEFHLFLLSDAEIIDVLDLLESSGYSCFTVINRYYDYPWALSGARARYTCNITMDELRRYVLAAPPSVISLISQ